MYVCVPVGISETIKAGQKWHRRGAGFLIINIIKNIRIYQPSGLALFLVPFTLSDHLSIGGD